MPNGYINSINIWAYRRIYIQEALLKNQFRPLVFHSRPRRNGEKNDKSEYLFHTASPFLHHF